MTSTFQWAGRALAYYDHPYNTTRLNERAVELPVALDWVARRPPGSVGLEVGNVLSHYVPVDHQVVDRWEPGAGVRNADVFDVTDRVDWVLAISTVEHVRWDEPERTMHGAAEAIEHLQSLLRPDGRMLVTVPFGWHPYLDRDIVDGRFEPEVQGTFVRRGAGWVYAAGEAAHRPYAATTDWAEAVWVAEFAAR